MQPATVPVRIPPLDPPYEPEMEAILGKWMPPGSTVEPLKLFRTLVRNREISERMRVLGAGILGRTSSIDLADREIVIDRVCARCGCEYEWGVHVTSFGPRLAISESVLQATASSTANDPIWSDRQRMLVRLVDELHDTSCVTDALWSELARVWSPEQLLELLTITGFYHMISFLANAAGVPLESWAARFPNR